MRVLKWGLITNVFEKNLKSGSLKSLEMQVEVMQMKCFC